MFLHDRRVSLKQIEKDVKGHFQIPFCNSIGTQYGRTCLLPILSFERVLIYFDISRKKDTLIEYLLMG